CRIGGSSCILQIIGSIMPTAAHIYMCTIWQAYRRCIHGKTIVCMAAIFQKGIKECTLLPHIAQCKICRAVINIICYTDNGGLYPSHLNDICSFLSYSRKIQSIGLYKSTIRAKRCRRFPFEYHFIGLCITQNKIMDWQIALADPHGYFFSLFSIPQLIDTYPCVLRKGELHNQRNEQQQNTSHRKLNFIITPSIVEATTCLSSRINIGLIIPLDSLYCHKTSPDSLSTADNSPE